MIEIHYIHSESTYYDIIDSSVLTFFRNPMRPTFVLLSFLCLAGCASPRPPATEIPSGGWRSTFKGVSTKEVVVKLVEKCGQIGGQIKDRRENYVLCSRRLSDADAALAGVSMDLVLAAKPDNRMEFTAQQVGPNVLVAIQQWAEVKNTDGRITRKDFTHPAQRSNMRKVMATIGGT